MGNQASKQQKAERLSQIEKNIEEQHQNFTNLNSRFNIAEKDILELIPNNNGIQEMRVQLEQIKQDISVHQGNEAIEVKIQESVNQINNSIEELHELMETNMKMIHQLLDSKVNMSDFHEYQEKQTLEKKDLETKLSDVAHETEIIKILSNEFVDKQTVYTIEKQMKEIEARMEENMMEKTEIRVEQEEKKKPLVRKRSNTFSVEEYQRAVKEAISK